MTDKVLSIRIPEQVDKWLDDTSENCGVSKSRIARDIIISGYTAQLALAHQVKQTQARQAAKTAKAQSKEASDSVDTTNQKPVEIHKKIGRNDPCPCGSGKKYKKCCGANN